MRWQPAIRVSTMGLVAVLTAIFSSVTAGSANLLANSTFDTDFGGWSP